MVNLVQLKRARTGAAKKKALEHACGDACARLLQYRFEKKLVDHFVECLAEGASPWGSVHYVREFDFQRGRPDVVIVRPDDSIVVVEAKLKRWRDALYQATRNRSFAQHSYVLLPRDVALRAEKHIEEFRLRNVGLCYIDCGKAVNVIFEPKHEAPLEPWLCRAATDAARDGRQSA